MPAEGDSETGLLCLDGEDLGELLRLLGAEGYETIGPTLGEGVIVNDVIRGVEDLARGWRDRQQAGHYRIEARDDGAFFGFNGAPQSWKRELFPPRIRRFDAEGDEHEIRFRTPAAHFPRRAFLGVRACELAAIQIQDRVFLGQAFTDPDYRGRRSACLLIALNCTEAGGTCFCADMGTGPAVGDGADLELTEVVDASEHWFLMEARSDAGRDIANKLQVARTATMAEVMRARQRVEETSRQMGRSLDTEGLREQLLENLQHPGWDEVAERCLGCANCALSCPTCFCSTTENTTDLSGSLARQDRVWDTCYSNGFSHLSHGPVRQSRKSRYRQWLTHKLATWHDQFGSSGCVGCGRCITFCPVGIDITAEAEKLRRPATVDRSEDNKEESTHARS